MTLDIKLDIKSVRREIRKQRRELSNYAYERAAEALFKQLQDLPAFQNGKKVGIYQSNDGEINLVPAVRWLWENHRKTYLPIIAAEEQEAMRFGEYTSQTRFKLNKYSIPEPDVAPVQQLDAVDLDLILMPLVAFDTRGNRIGMGGGYYDRTFAFRREGGASTPLLIGVAHHFQQYDALQPEEWDVPLDGVVTDRNTWLF